jgi:hypothetical protein
MYGTTRLVYYGENSPWPLVSTWPLADWEKLLKSKNQCCGLSDPWHFGTDLDPEPLTNASGSGSCYFPRWPSRRQQKTNFLKSLCLLLYLLTSFVKDKKSQRSQKTVGIKVFLTIFAWGYGTSCHGIRIRNTAKNSWHCESIWKFLRYFLWMYRTGV